ncbi:hypothetical protein PG997_000023 [Apiospora hydei]|uniref:Cyanovirin-N domain-containing protein n=1 Tax=Apiospora hydei TaxID=1337664 RepID=A0ABR1X9K8_9PEZI
MMIFAYILALIVGFAFADGPIENTCSEWGIWNPAPHVWYLKGTCSANNGTSVCSYASLSSCYAVDDNGQLHPERFGDGPVKCKNCVTDQLRMTCDCKDKHGYYHTTETGLDEAMTNKDGYLGCFDLVGYQCDDTNLFTSRYHSQFLLQIPPTVIPIYPQVTMKTFAYIAASITALTARFTSADLGSVGQDCADVSLWNPGHWLDVSRRVSFFLIPEPHLPSQSGVEPICLCFVEVNGQLQPQEGGKGLRNCDQCTIDNFAMSCHCRDDNGDMVDTTINLNDTMSVEDNGWVACFNTTTQQC